MRASRTIATMVASTVIATGALVALPSSAAADTGDTVSTSEIAAALGSTDASNGGLVAEPVPSTTDADSAAVVKQENTTIEVPRDPEDGVSLQSDGAPEITVSLPNADASKDAVRLKDGTVAYPGTNGSAQAVIPMDGGVQMLTTIAEPTAPTRYDYKVDVPDGGRVEVSPDNAGAVVLDSKGNPVVFVPAPWAKDASGTTVPTHFEKNGTTLTQVVNHTGGNYMYPVVADPKIQLGFFGYTLHLSRAETKKLAQTGQLGGVLATKWWPAALALGLTGWYADYVYGRRLCIGLYVPYWSGLPAGNLSKTWPEKCQA